MTTDPGARIARLQERFRRLDRQRLQALAEDDLATAEDRLQAMAAVNKTINRLMGTLVQERDRG